VEDGQSYTKSMETTGTELTSLLATSHENSSHPSHDFRTFPDGPSPLSGTFNTLHSIVAWLQQWHPLDLTDLSEIVHKASLQNDMETFQCGCGEIQSKMRDGARLEGNHMKILCSSIVPTMMRGNLAQIEEMESRVNEIITLDLSRYLDVGIIVNDPSPEFLNWIQGKISLSQIKVMLREAIVRGNLNIATWCWELLVPKYVVSINFLSVCVACAAISRSPSMFKWLCEAIYQIIVQGGRDDLIILCKDIVNTAAAWISLIKHSDITNWFLYESSFAELISDMSLFSKRRRLFVSSSISVYKEMVLWNDYSSRDELSKLFKSRPIQHEESYYPYNIEFWQSFIIYLCQLKSALGANSREDNILSRNISIRDKLHIQSVLSTINNVIRMQQAAQTVRMK
jgi:hypothetical protein